MVVLVIGDGLGHDSDPGAAVSLLRLDTEREGGPHGVVFFQLPSAVAPE